MADFDIDNLEPDLPQNVRLVIADLVLAWARFDALVSQLLIQVFNLPLESGSILIGNMDTRAKFDRMIKLYEHLGSPNAQTLKELRTLHSRHVDLRNTVTHASCGGVLKSDPDWVVFAPVRVMKGELGSMTIEQHHISRIAAAVMFAKENGDEINRLLERTYGDHGG